MHFHHELMDSIRLCLGLGNNGALNFYKYSQRNECFVGFDQGYISSQLSHEEMFNLLKDSSQNDNYRLHNRFFGYFLQYKVVKEMQRFSKNTPRDKITSIPHYRVKLDTKSNKLTGLSQHEQLYNLSRNLGALVYYACPMIFNREELYESANLERLKLIEVDDRCPASTLSGEHHIYFSDPASIPHWCSEAVSTKFQNIEDLQSKIKDNLSNENAEFNDNFQKILNKPEEFKKYYLHKLLWFWLKNKRYSALNSFTLLHLKYD